MKNVLQKDSIKFLKKYLSISSPVGYEEQGQKIWINYINSYVDNVNTDLYGTAIGIINKHSKNKLVIESHADEISWYVNYISEDGIIYVTYNGGSDSQIAISKKVLIHTKNGYIPGIFGWPAIHIRKSSLDGKRPNVNNIFIDVGATTKKEVHNMGINIGSIVSYPNTFFVMNNNYFVSKALDNKIGGFVIAEVAKMLNKYKIKLNFGLYIVNSVQEEVGFRGAKMISQYIKPKIAIITDVTHDTSIPMIEKKTQGDIKCGLGPVINYSPSIRDKIRELIINTADKNEIPFQRLVSSGHTGTDTETFAYSNTGALCALTSIPLKYMHTTVEMLHKQDVEQLIILIFETLKEINKNTNEFFFD